MDNAKQPPQRDANQLQSDAELSEWEKSPTKIKQPQIGAM